MTLRPGARHAVNEGQKIRISGVSFGDLVAEESARCIVKLAYSNKVDGAEKEAALCCLLPGQVRRKHSI